MTPNFSEIISQQVASVTGGVTQMPHPLLNSMPPFYQLHPCHTVNWMGEMRENVSKESNYLVTWLSFMAPYCGIQVSEKYAIK